MVPLLIQKLELHGGSNALENVYINRNSSDVEIGVGAFGWAEGYSEDVNLHWNSTGPTG